MSNIRWIWSYVRPYSGYALLNITMNILSVLFSLFSIGMVAPFLGLLFGTQELILVKPELDLFSADGVIANLNYYISIAIVEQGKANALMLVCWIVIVFVLLKNLFRYLGMYFLSPIRNNVSRDLRNNLYDKVTHLPIGYFSNERKGDIMARMTSDVQEIEWTILASLEASFRDPFNILFFLGALLYMSPQLTLFIFIMLPVSGLIIGGIGRSLKRNAVKGQEKMGYLLSLMDETLGGLRIIKAFTGEAFTNKRFQKNNQEYTSLMNRMLRKRDLASPLSEFLGTAVLVGVMWYGGKLIFSGETGLLPNVFIAYIALFSQVLTPAKSITTAYYNVKKGVASAERIRQILEAENTITEKADAKSISTFEQEISYENVFFRYPSTEEDKWILKGTNLKVPKGKTIALVGQSGSGKSTLVDLLPRFYDSIEGEIRIDGISTRDLKLQDLRKLMGVVTQESILFNDTIFNNIAFGMPNATEEDVMNAAKVANAHEFIEKMEYGYHTNIGDRGMNLSGGQRQRMSIARAVLKNPPILILDEATSALDTESERLVQDALTNLMKNRTSLVIAHRLSTIQHADEIIVMQQGEIVERGTHDELLQQSGAYKRLYDLQAFV